MSLILEKYLPVGRKPTRDSIEIYFVFTSATSIENENEVHESADRWYSRSHIPTYMQLTNMIQKIIKDAITSAIMAH